MASSITRLARGVSPTSPTTGRSPRPMMNSTAVRTFAQLDVHVLEHARGHALALADEAQEQVLRADVVVVEPLRLVLRERQDLACAVRELVESIHRAWSPIRCRTSQMCRQGHASTLPHDKSPLGIGRVYQENRIRAVRGCLGTG